MDQILQSIMPTRYTCGITFPLTPLVWIAHCMFMHVAKKVAHTVKVSTTVPILPQTLVVYGGQWNMVSSPSVQLTAGQFSCLLHFHAK